MSDFITAVAKLLHNYQQIAVKFALERPAAGLFMAPGLGKTIITLLVFAILRKKKIIKGSMLVVAKRRIIRGVWPLEVIKWGMPCKVSLVHGTPKERMAALQEEADIYLCTFEGLEWLSANRDKFGTAPEMLVIDESSKMKSHRSDRFKALCRPLRRKKAKRDKKTREILEAATPKRPPFINMFKRRMILTGSPAPQSLMDLWSQIFILDGGAALGPNITAFRNNYFAPSGYMGYKWKPMPGSEEEIFDAIRGLVIRFGEDELDLPKLMFVNRWVSLNEDTIQLYKELEEEFITEWDGNLVTAKNAAVATGKLRQIANGGLYKDRTPVDELGKKLPKGKKRPFHHIHDEKVEELVELIEELNGTPCLVAYEFNHDLERIKKALPDVPHIGSGVPDAVADHLIDQFNAGEIPVLLGHPDSIAHGLNLQGSGNVVIFFSLTWNLENYEQFIRRIRRQGQKAKRVFVYHIVASGTVDEIILEVLDGKDKTQQRLLKALDYRYGGNQCRRS